MEDLRGCEQYVDFSSPAAFTVAALLAGRGSEPHIDTGLEVLCGCGSPLNNRYGAQAARVAGTHHRYGQKQHPLTRLSGSVVAEFSDTWL